MVRTGLGDYKILGAGNGFQVEEPGAEGAVGGGRIHYRIKIYNNISDDSVQETRSDL